MFNWTHIRVMLRENATGEQSRALADWQRKHGTNREDFTPDQHERFVLFTRALEAGINFLAVAFWRHQVRSKLVQP